MKDDFLKKGSGDSPGAYLIVHRSPLGEPIKTPTPLPRPTPTPSPTPSSKAPFTTAIPYPMATPLPMPLMPESETTPSSPQSSPTLTAIEIPNPPKRKRRPVPEFKFYDDDEEGDDEDLATTDVFSRSFLEQVECEDDSEVPTLEMAVQPGEASAANLEPSNERVSLLLRFKAFEHRSRLAIAVTVILGALVVSGVSVVLTAFLLGRGETTGEPQSSARASLAGGLRPPQVPAPVRRQSSTVEISPSPSPARDSTQGAEGEQGGGALERTLGSLTDEVRLCAGLTRGYHPREITVHVVPGEERRAVVSAITPEPPLPVARCIARTIHRATWPGPRAEAPLTVHTYQLEPAR